MGFLGLRQVPLIVGVTGPTKAGKTMVANYLATDHDFHYTSLSMLLREKALLLGNPSPDWRDLRKVAVQWRREQGNAVLVRTLFNQPEMKIALRTKDRIVVDGILHPEEVKALSFKPTFVLIAITAGRKQRFEIATNHVSIERVPSWEEFVERDRWEMGKSATGTERDPAAPNIGQCIKMADPENHFKFEGREADLFEEIRQFLARHTGTQSPDFLQLHWHD
jgi:hypothetical protein